MLGITLFSLTISIATFLAGAWPVFGFMGLDIALVYCALRLSYRRQRESEVLELDEHALTVEHTGQDGVSRKSRLQPAWLRVELAEPILAQTPVLLRSHGQVLSIGVFLHPEQRRQIAHDLRRALDEWRQPRPLID